jgi:GT2 family glycosyltransferase
MTGVMPSVATIVLGWNHCDDSSECIQSILEAGYSALHVWYVDNGSTDDSPGFLRQKFSNIAVIELGENRGLVGGYNAGIQAALSAEPEYVCVFNNDVAVQPGIFQALVDTARANDRVGVLAPKIVLYSNEHVIWSAGARMRRFPPGIVQRGMGASSDDPHFGIAQPVEYATSCAWMMATSMVRDVGLFDPRYPFYYSDYDYCKRVSLCNWQIFYVPSAIVKHKVSLSTQKSPTSARWWQNMGEAEARFYRQYGSNVQLALHCAWMVVRALLQRNARYLPDYIQGLRHATDI